MLLPFPKPFYCLPFVRQMELGGTCDYYSCFADVFTSVIIVVIACGFGILLFIKNSFGNKQYWEH